MPIDYSKGKIYKIISDSTDKIYIGSTCQSLSNRLAKHKSSFERWKRVNKGYATSFEIIKFDDYKIILIKDTPSSRKEELEKYEREVIEENKNICVNKNMPTRNHNEWCIETNYNRKEHDKEYQIKNKEKILEKAKIKRNLIKDDTNAKNRIKIKCECGLEINKSSMHRHLKRSIHQIKLLS